MKTNLILADIDIADRNDFADAIATLFKCCVVVKTSDDNELLGVCKTVKCDLLISDLALPTAAELETRESIESVSKRPKILVLSDAVSESILKTLTAGCGDCITVKPCKLEKVIQLLGQNSGSDNKDEKCGDMRDEIVLDVTDVLHRLGIPASIKGYRYLRDAVLMACDDFGVLDCVTKSLYPKLADRYNTTVSRVERSIRHAIEVGWERGDINALHEYFGYTVSMSKGKPTNSEFISIVADSIRLGKKI